MKVVIITCPECGRQISEYSTVCIGCGVPTEIIKKILSEPSPKAVTRASENNAAPGQVITTHSKLYLLTK